MAKKHILITGVSSGLGHALAEKHLLQGDEVYGISRRTPEDLVALGLHHLALDLSAGETIAHRFKDFIPFNEDWDVVYLNAGKLGKIRDMVDTPLEDLRETMEINVWANKWLLDGLFAISGKVHQVVAISSGASHSGARGWNGYGISKAALNMLIKLYAAEKEDTHFCAFAPGLVDTAMQDYLTGDLDAETFPIVQRLREAKGTENMPAPSVCADKIIALLPALLNSKSGSFQDIREI
ncbi:MAG: SDR family NAD(P)-dependent oxidoreductase [Opitutales bacterium]|nr:SDR family NAD(P)-dependent oxidoreductase [Opitutales bacterium]MCH8539559.1 SDR family NAD(P)-dependent oxidoreductase [Opitutales bacterium]